MTTPHQTAARRFVVIGAVSAGLAVAAGAFGAHALRARVEPRLLEVFETGARYQMYHALALLVVAVLLARWGGPEASNAATAAATSATVPAAAAARSAVVAGWCFLAGTLLFSGSLYLMTFTGARALGAVTPFGGVAFLAGWGALAHAGWRAR